MKKHLVEGIVKRHPDGFGFLVPDDKEVDDVYIPRHSMNGVMTNDRVQVNVERNSWDKRLSGEIVKIIKHATTRIVGIYSFSTGKNGYLADDENRWGMNLNIAPHNTKNAKNGELVAVEVLTYPGDPQGFTGKIVEVLGDANNPLTDLKRVVISHSIPTEFSKEAIQESKRFKPEVSPEDYRVRKDLRDVPFITIDGATAKDFDDAICVKTTAGGFHLWVGIADVSYYVEKGSAIDRDAYERGNSTYFPHFVFPMLPEILSNELCSLRPQIPRLALVAEMTINFQGEILTRSFYEAVIESRHRVTYGEAQEVVDGTGDPKFNDVKQVILKAADLAKILQTRRFRDGSLDLDVPQTQIILDDAGVPIDISRSERLFAHRLIEELMLIANIAVGEFLADAGPAIYRIHEEPAADNLEILENYMRNFGAQMKSLSGGNLQKKITKALQAFENRPEATILNILTLRAMKQAQYSPHNVGHFGLGFETYTHFTSPIRRYSDLIVHRLVKAALLKSDKKSRGSIKGAAEYSEPDLENAGTQLSACEQRSVKAERQFQAIKKARFMSDKVGQEFDGIISSVTKFGVFVLLRAFDVDGLVKIEELGNDYFEFDEQRLILTGRKTKQMFRIGDELKIQIARTDIELGQIDFVRAGKDLEKRKPFDIDSLLEQRRPKGKSALDKHGKTNRKDSKKRGSSKDDRGGPRKKRVSARRRKG